MVNVTVLNHNTRVTYDYRNMSVSSKSWSTINGESIYGTSGGLLFTSVLISIGTNGLFSIMRHTCFSIMGCYTHQCGCIDLFETEHFKVTINVYTEHLRHNFVFFNTCIVSYQVTGIITTNTKNVQRMLSGNILRTFLRESFLNVL